MFYVMIQLGRMYSMEKVRVIYYIYRISRS